MRIRPYTAADCPAVLALFYHTVHTVNRQHYTPDQLDAWAPADPDTARWDSSLRRHTALVAEDEAGRLLGFADMDVAAGYLDRLYVAAGCQRQGGGHRPVRRAGRAAGARRPGDGARLPDRPALF